MMHKTHGMSGTPLYGLWKDIKKRCSSKASERHRRFYEGIFICEGWLKFENFYRWAKPRWKKGLDIDRINTLKGYSPLNCRFVTRKKNAQNSKRAKRWYIEGRVFESSTDAAKFFGVVQSTIWSWCMGKRDGKYSYSPKKSCYAVKKYKEIV